jgi:MFS transporter, PPP family, 3-phenylpropionic acid transporter
MAVGLLQAAALAPLVPLADALSLAHARPQQNTAGFEYGWVRGVGSAAFVAGTLLAGQAAGGYGLSAIIWLSATALLATPIAASFVPPFPAKAARVNSNGEIPHRPWLTLLRQRAFVRVTLVAALVLGSHAMYDSFAVIRWTQAGISPQPSAYCGRCRSSPRCWSFSSWVQDCCERLRRLSHWRWRHLAGWCAGRS